MPRYYSLSWEQRFHDLLEFREKNGHCKVPQFYRANQPLANWVKNQRNSYKVKQRGKRSSLTDEREAALNAIGFNWTLRNKLGSQGTTNCTTGKRKSSCASKILPVRESKHVSNKKQRHCVSPSPERSLSVALFPIGIGSSTISADRVNYVCEEALDIALQEVDKQNVWEVLVTVASVILS